MILLVFIAGGLTAQAPVETIADAYHEPDTITIPVAVSTPTPNFIVDTIRRHAIHQ